MAAEILSQDDFFNWSLNQLARAFGVARETVSKRLMDSGVRPSGERRGHPVYPVKLAAQAILMPQGYSGGWLDDPTKMAPSDRRHWFASERDRLALEREQGLLVTADEARQQMAEIINLGLPILESLPDELERDFQLPPEVVAAVESRVDSLRSAWADALQGDD